MSKHPILTFVSTAFGATVLTLAWPTTDVLARAADVLGAPAREACTGYCVACIGNPGHAADRPHDCDLGYCSEYDAAEGAGWHTDCSGANNCGGHSCRMEHDLLDEERALTADSLFAQVTRAVRGADGAVLQALVRANPKRARYFAPRHAIQLVACDGEVTAHYPLTQEVQLASLQ